MLLSLNMHYQHKKLWTWLLHNKDKDKYAWPDWKHNGGRIPMIPSFCFPCTVAKIKKNNTSNNNNDKDITCNYCPIINCDTYHLYQRAKYRNMACNRLINKPWHGDKIYKLNFKLIKKRNFYEDYNIITD